MATTKMDRAALCPECDAEVRFKSPPNRGQRITCHRCGAKLQVVARNPVELDWAANYTADSMGDSKRKKRDIRRGKRGEDDWDYGY